MHIPTAIAEETGDSLYQVAITAGGHDLLADEPVELGGQNTGPNPFDLLCAALAACTTMTLRMYARRKGMNPGCIRTEVIHSRDAAATPPDLFTRRILIEGDVGAEARERLLAIANRCPVHATLGAGARVETGLEQG